MRQSKLLMATLLLTLLLTACSSMQVSKTYQEVTSTPANTRVPEVPLARDSTASKAGLAEIKANEAGRIMILMYHQIGASQEGDWAQTTDNFRRDLQKLYDQGYSLISLRDLVNNNIKTAAGRTPLVLTFDDGTEGHFRYLVQDGETIIDPACAVGILLAFAEQHPDFGSTATFYINAQPFGQAEYWEKKLKHLVELGFDLGNHTLDHPALSKLSTEQVQRELAGLAKVVEEQVPGYQVSSLALPHGLSPQEGSLAVEGSYEGYNYKNLAVLRVGANPTVAPNVQGFNPARLPRVQASTKEVTKWLDYFQKNPQERYISDGDPLTIAIPLEREGQIVKKSLQQKELVTWQ